MNTHQAFMHLVKGSLILPASVRILLLKRIPSMTSDQMRRLGKWLAIEREIVLRNQEALIAANDKLVDALIGEAKGSGGTAHLGRVS